MKKIILCPFAFILFACTDYTAQYEEQYGDVLENDDYYGNYTPSPSNNLPIVICNEGATQSTSVENCVITYLCQNNTWVPQAPVCSGTQTNVICEEGASTSLEDGTCTFLYTCSNNAWIPVGEPQCEALPIESSESQPVIESSSSVNSSNISVSEINTSSYNCSKAMFCGKSGDTRVETGFNDGTKSYGYWYEYDDSGNGGNSSFTWQYGGTADDFVQKSVSAYGGIKGTASIGNAYENAYVGLGFDIGGRNLKGYNISGWNGVCVIYQSTAPLQLELHVANEATVTKYDNPIAVLPQGNSSSTTYLADIPWSAFTQGGWGNPITTTTATQSTAMIAFKFTENNSFAIFAFGKYGTCK